VCRFRERHRWRGDAAKLREVEHLHAVIDRLAHDERVVCKNLDAAPSRADGLGGKVSEIDRLPRIGDVDERGTGGAPDQRVLASRQWIGPTPDVVPGSSAHLAVRQEGHEIDVAAWIASGHTISTGDSDQ